MAATAALDLAAVTALIREERATYAREVQHTARNRKLLELGVQLEKAAAQRLKKAAVKAGKGRRKNRRRSLGAAEAEESPELDYGMFVHLLTSGRLDRYVGLDADDWQNQAYQMRLLKHAWETADLDSDGVLTELELRKTGPAAPGRTCAPAPNKTRGPGAVLTADRP